MDKNSEINHKINDQPELNKRLQKQREKRLENINKASLIIQRNQEEFAKIKDLKGYPKPKRYKLLANIGANKAKIKSLENENIMQDISDRKSR